MTQELAAPTWFGAWLPGLCADLGPHTRGLRSCLLRQISSSDASSAQTPQVREHSHQAAPLPLTHTMAVPEPPSYHRPRPAGDTSRPSIPLAEAGQPFRCWTGPPVRRSPGPFVFSGSSLLCVMWKKLVIPVLPLISQQWTWEGSSAQVSGWPDGWCPQAVGDWAQELGKASGPAKVPGPAEGKVL